MGRLLPHNSKALVSSIEYCLLGYTVELHFSELHVYNEKVSNVRLSELVLYKLVRQSTYMNCLDLYQVHMSRVTL